jgi:hypothetical protein
MMVPRSGGLRARWNATFPPANSKLPDWLTEADIAVSAAEYSAQGSVAA